MPDFSVIIPAFNEEALLSSTLSAIQTAIEAQPLHGEIIVVDNNSTDNTAAIAKAHQAHVVFEPHNQIARARNTGAKASNAPFLIFIDADTLIPSPLLDQALQTLTRSPCVGGGAVICFDQDQSRFAKIGLDLWTFLSIHLNLAAGSFLFCRADAFRAMSGFPEHVYAGEELHLSRRLKKWGRAHQLDFKILCRYPVTTSARKLDWYSPTKIMLSHLILALIPPLARSQRFCRFWYDRPHKTTGSNPNDSPPE